jgi:hypothetical protein
VQVADPLAVQQQVLRAGGRLGDHVVGAAGREALQAEDHGALHVVVDGLDLVDRDPERLGQLLRRRRAPEGRR